MSEPAVHRPYGTLRHLAGLASRDGVAGLSIGLDREFATRARWTRSMASDYLTERRHASRPKMRSLAIAPAGRAWWREIAAPADPGPGAAIVHPIAIATCDLDRALALGRTILPLPMHLGHECVAEVVSIGDGVTAVAPGDRVVVPYQISCGDCQLCHIGQTAHCLSVPPATMYGMGITGGNRGGFITDLVAVPFADAMLVRLPDGVSPEAAASVSDNVTSAYSKVAQHASMILRYADDARVIILGEIGRRLPIASSMALYVGLSAQALGINEVHLVDRDPVTRAHAEALGFQVHAPAELTSLPRAPFVFDSTGTSRGLAKAIKAVLPGGVCSSTGSLHHSSAVPASLMYMRDVSLHLGMSSVRPVIPVVLDLIASGVLHPELVTSRVASLDDAPKEIRAYAAGNGAKLVLTGP